MPFIPQQAPPSMDTDGLRKHGEEQFREVARAWTEVEASIASLNASLAAVIAGLPASYVTSIATLSGAFTLNGTSGITNLVNDIRLSPASASQFGAVKVDGTTITAAAGVISSVAPAGNPWVLLNTLTANGSGPTLSDTTSFTSTYQDYEIVFTNLVPATNAVNLQFQVRSGGTFQTTSYLCTTFNTSGSVTVGEVSPTTYIALNGNNTINNAVPGLSGSIRVSAPSGSATPKIFVGQSANLTGAVVQNSVISGYWNNNAAIDGFRVQTSAGNITSGTVRIYGRT